MTIRDLYRALDEKYPRSLSCSWDNDGLMVCADPEREVKRVLLALDASNEAIDYAIKERCQVLLTHHPLLFRPMRSLSPDFLSGDRTLTAIKGELAVMSFHTRLDAGQGGVNDALCDALGLTAAGCFGDDEAPTLGRLAHLEGEMPLSDFAAKVKQSLGCSVVLFSGNRPVKTVAMIGGGGGDFIYAAKAAGADTFITGDAGYNVTLDAADDGINIIQAGHYHTEAPVLSRLADFCRSIAGAECLFFDSNPIKTV